MGKLIMMMNFTLDGVVQAPGGKDEDTRGGFQHGGWATPYGAMQSKEVMSSGMDFGALLFGRQTYETFYSYWPHQPQNPMTDMLNTMTKYVASTTLEAPLPWQNSILLKGEITDAINEVKAQSDKDILIMGSANLLKSLMHHRLVDSFVFLIHPLVLGSGQSLATYDDSPVTLRLVDTKSTDTGVIVAIYEPESASEG